MKKFAVAVCNLYENTNTIKIVEAESEKDAVVLAVGDCLASFEDWDLEDVIQNYFDGDMVVSNPVEI